MGNIDEFYIKGNLTIQIIKTILTKEQLLNKEQTEKKKKKQTKQEVIGPPSTPWLVMKLIGVISLVHLLSRYDLIIRILSCWVYALLDFILIF